MNHEHFNFFTYIICNEFNTSKIIDHLYDPNPLKPLDPIAVKNALKLLILI